MERPARGRRGRGPADPRVAFAPLPDGWTAEFRRGYGEALDAAAIAFYRTVHLANLGYHAALTGIHAHAADLLQAARAAVSEFRRLLRKVRASHGE